MGGRGGGRRSARRAPARDASGRAPVRRAAGTGGAGRLAAACGLTGAGGVPSPFAPTVGRGEAVVLRDGKAYRGTWSRPKASDGTEFTFQGRRMTFHPGRVWVVLEP